MTASTIWRNKTSINGSQYGKVISRMPAPPYGQSSPLKPMKKHPKPVSQYRAVNGIDSLLTVKPALFRNADC